MDSRRSDSKRKVVSTDSRRGCTGLLWDWSCLVDRVPGFHPSRNEQRKELTGSRAVVCRPFPVPSTPVRSVLSVVSFGGKVSRPSVRPHYRLRHKVPGPDVCSSPGTRVSVDSVGSVPRLNNSSVHSSGETFHYYSSVSVTGVGRVGTLNRRLTHGKRPHCTV